MRVTTKDLVIGERKFQLRKFTPLVGAWVGNVLLATTLNQKQAASEAGPTSEEFQKLPPEEKARAAVAAMWLMAADSLPREKYEQIQQECLLVCSLYLTEGAPPVPIFMTGGRWAMAEVGDDLSTVNQLVTEVLQFNLAPFFNAGGPVEKPSSPPEPLTFSSSAPSFHNSGGTVNSGTVLTR